MACVICNCEFEVPTDVKKVKSKGILTFIESSKERGDGKWKKWKNSEELEVHETCRTSYNKTVAISASKRRRISVPGGFDYQLNCIICKQQCDKKFESKRSVARRRTICFIAPGASWTETLLDICDVNGSIPEINDINERIHIVMKTETAEGRYHDTCLRSLINKYSYVKKGTKFSAQFQKLFTYLDDSEQCQWELDDLITIMGEPVPTTYYLKDTLRKKYGDKIIFRTYRREKILVSLAEPENPDLQSYFKRTLSATDDEELKINIIKRAAEIIREDVCKKSYDIHEYPTATEFFKHEHVSGVIPDSLQLFLEEMILKKNKNKKGPARKITGIAHSIISATRPDSFLSTIQLSLSLYVQTKFQCKLLISVLNRLGICSSYAETKLFEGSAVMANQPQGAASDSSFIQYVFDNVHRDTIAIDGNHTLHCTGGIECVTPKNSLKDPEPITRLSVAPTAAQLTEKNNIPVVPYVGFDDKGLSTIDIKDIEQLRTIESKNTFLLAPELCWVSGQWLKVREHPRWHDFMEIRTKNSAFDESAIKFLPLIHLKATDPDALYTAMMFGINESKKNGQADVFFTFDQQLYIKAREMVANVKASSVAEAKQMEYVFIRLGGFHLVESFLGSIGKIMAGSGLKELWSQIYAEKFIDKMLTGRDYIRSIRSNFLTQQELIKIILDEDCISSAIKDQLKHVMSPAEAQSEESSTPIKRHQTIPVLSTLDELVSCSSVQIFIKLFHDHLASIKNRGKTATLWVQYIKMVSLIRTFLQAEKMGNWNLHLSTIIEMIPFFHSSNNLRYAKSAHLYVQDMLDLDKNMSSAKIYKQYTSGGYFTIRRNSVYFSGTPADKVIEETLMRRIHNSGGLRHGQGTAKSVASIWNSSSLCSANLCDDLELFCGLASTDEHKDFQDSTIEQDHKDSLTLKDWLKQHPPFPLNPYVISLASGIIGGPEINCWDAENVGRIGYQQMLPQFTVSEDGTLQATYQNFDNVEMTDNSGVLPISIANGYIELRNTKFPINHTVLFERFQLVDLPDESLLEILSHELCPIPIALFDNATCMRQAKDDIKTFFDTCPQPFLNPSNVEYIIDADTLLSLAPWPEKATFADLYKSYSDYLMTSFNSLPLIIFESQSKVNANPKLAQIHRSLSNTKCPDVLFNPNTKVTMKRNHLLSNINNKELFKTQLAHHLVRVGYPTKFSVQFDVDSVIVNEALKRSEHGNDVVIVSDSFNLFFILLSKANICSNIYIRRSNKNWYSCFKMFEKYPSFDKKILCLNALTGCQTTSSIFKVTKKKVFKEFLKADNDDLLQLMDVFISSSSSYREIVESGEKLLMAIYKSGRFAHNLNDLRVTNYLKHKKVKKMKLQLASLPPTSAAAAAHSARVYWQVQYWLDNVLPATEWGWYNNLGMLYPISTGLPPAPERFLYLISCACQNCAPRTCTCFNAGLCCSNFCKNCQDVDCKNSNPELPDEVDDTLDYLEADSSIEIDNNQISEIHNIESMNMIVDDQEPVAGPSHFS